MMKWLLAFLLIANVVLYFWHADLRDESASLPSAQLEVNRGSMLLQNEAPASLAASPTALTNCYRIGPFRNRADRYAAMWWMDAQEFAYRAVESDARAMRTVEVYLGPFKSRAAAQPTTDKLEDADIHHFVGQHETDGVHISLGYFLQQSLAASFIAHLTTQNVAAKSRIGYRDLGQLAWLETSSADAAQPELRAQLLAHNWRDKNIVVMAISCATN